jgi:hypothetical protein
MSPDIQRELAEFDAEVREELNDDTLSQQFPSAAERAKEAQRFSRGEEVARNRHVNYEMYTDDDSEIETGLSVDDFHDENPTPDQEPGQADITGATVLLNRDGTQQRATIKGQKRDNDGNVIPGDDFVVEFPDGTQVVHQYSALLDAIYVQVDENGEEWYTFNDIISHQKRARGGRGKTRGWFLQVEWMNGEVTWETLTSLKESNPYEVAVYARNNELLDEPAFSYWAKHVLRKHDRYVRAARKRKTQ